MLPIDQIQSPEFRKHGKTPDAEEVIVILPDFLIPRRPYPVEVYLYACKLYVENPNLSQREAAKKTKELFQLKTFAHTTLGRVLKKLREAAEKEKADQTGGMPINPDSSAAPESLPDTPPSTPVDSPGSMSGSGDDKSKRHFPSLSDTLPIRSAVAELFNTNLPDIKEKAFIICCRKLVHRWYLHYQRFLI